MPRRTVITLAIGDNPEPKYASVDECFRANVHVLAQLIAAADRLPAPHTSNATPNGAAVRERVAHG